MPEEQAAEKEPVLDTWVQDGMIALVIRNSSIIESQGELVPGMSLSIPAALGVIANLAEQIKAALSPEEESEEP